HERPAPRSRGRIAFGCTGSQPLASKQAAGFLLRDPDLNSRFRHDHAFTKCLSSFALTATSKTARCALRARRNIQLRPHARGTRTTPLPGSDHVIDEREAAHPHRSEPRLTAGSGPAAAIPTLFGVSLSQTCPGRRRAPTWGPWLSTGPATPSTPCSIR